ncbi:MAG: molecular chaperone TorD family protein [Dehalococcoidia bacterium]|nr:molecular chaperone TorD family protein [Dehalococcoidia bacterium]
MTAPAGQGSALADCYGLLAELLSFPGTALEAAIRDGALRSAAGHIAAHLPGLETPDLDAIGPVALAPKELEREYIRLFDVPDGPATPMYTGVYAPRRRDAMEELLRLYRHFGLSTRDGLNDLPDFVPTVLEFARFLAAGEAAQAPGGAFARARRDLLDRHLAPWARQTHARLADRAAHPFYRTAVTLTATLTTHDLATT